MGFLSKFLDGGERVAAAPSLGEGRDDSIGGILRRAREAKEYAVADVARALRIRRAHLEAIEANRFDELPGALYAAGFIRGYAALVDADADALVARFRALPGGTVRKPELVLPAPPPETRLPGGVVMLVAVVLAVSAYGGWYYLSATDQSLADVVPGLPSEFQAMLDEVPAAAGVGGYQASGASANELPPGSIDELIGTLDDAPDASAGATAPQAAAATPAATDMAPGGSVTLESLAVAASAETGPRPATPAATRIVLRALSDSWVRVADGQGETVMETLLRPGQVYEVPADQSGLVLDTGNAGGLEISVGDRALPSLGGQGQVVRGVPLDPQRLLAGTSPG